MGVINIKHYFQQINLPLWMENQFRIYMFKLLELCTNLHYTLFKHDYSQQMEAPCPPLHQLIALATNWCAGLCSALQ